MKYTLFFVLSFSFLQLNAQSSLKQNLNQYFEFLTTENYEMAVEMMHPRLFKQYPKEMVVKQLSSMSTGIGKLSIEDHEISDVSPTYTLRDTVYAAVKVKSILKLPLVPERMNDAKTIESGFIQQYGEENVSYDEARGEFTLHSEERMLAVSFNDANSWVFIGSMDTPNAQQFFPEQVYQHFNP